MPFFRRESFNEDSSSGCSLVSRARCPSARAAPWRSAVSEGTAFRNGGMHLHGLLSRPPRGSGLADGWVILGWLAARATLRSTGGPAICFLWLSSRWKSGQVGDTKPYVPDGSLCGLAWRFFSHENVEIFLLGKGKLLNSFLILVRHGLVPYTKLADADTRTCTYSLVNVCTQTLSL